MLRPAFILSLFACAVHGQVVINEIFYHAPDDWEDLQYVELHNAGPAAVDLSGWGFTKGVKFRFPPGARVEAGGFVVVCRNVERFRQFHAVPVVGAFSDALKVKGERIELSDASGKVVDSVKFRDRDPWPTGPDGQSASLERIAVTGPSEDPANWIGSPLSTNRDVPGGTPGKPNTGRAERMPPVIEGVAMAPERPVPGQEVTVEARLRAGTVATVVLLHRLAGPGFEKPEEAVPMQASSDGKWVGKIPARAAGGLVRFRVRATAATGEVRHYPAETEPRPALSYLLMDPVTPAAIPFAWVIHTVESEAKAGKAQVNPAPFFGFGPPPDPMREVRDEGRRTLERELDLSRLWLELTTADGVDAARVELLRGVFQELLGAARQRMQDVLGDPGFEPEKIAAAVKEFHAGLAGVVGKRWPEAQQAVLKAWPQTRLKAVSSKDGMVLLRADIEGAWQALTASGEGLGDRYGAAREAVRKLVAERAEILAALATGAGRDRFFRDERDRAEALGDRIAGVLKAAAGEGVVERLERWRKADRAEVVGLREAAPRGRGEPFGPGGPFGPFGPGGMRPGMGGPPGAGVASTEPPPSHRSAFAYRDPATGRVELYDFVQVTGRKGGQKVHFGKGQSLDGMTTIGLTFEGEMAALVEPLAYEVYRLAGLPTERSYHVRLWQDGEPAGYQLLVEQPNRAFLRRNGKRDDGNLYKLIWYGGSVEGQHEKKTQVHGGHDDVVKLIEELPKQSGEAQWEFIRRNFEVDEVAGYFAVNMVLSHWDGFFNNYFTYHDVHGTGRWTMFPWDQDSTWGLRRMGGDGGVFFNMAVTFGMTGDQPSGAGGEWRPPGFFSGPLLANPQFRRVFLKRTRDLLEKVYTEAVFGPIFADYERRLVPEARLRAQIQQTNPDDAERMMRETLKGAREHLRLRQEFLLANEEIRNVGRK